MSSAQGKQQTPAQKATGKPLKAKVCKYYQQGICSYGENCRFTHSSAAGAEDPPNEPKAHVVPMASVSFKSGDSSSEVPPSGETSNNSGKSGKTKDTQAKSRQLRKGQGGKADRLQPKAAAAPVTTPPPPHVPAAASAKGPRAVKLKPCFVWRDRGSCLRGDCCVYSHDPKIREDEVRRLQTIRQQEKKRVEDERRRLQEERDRIQQQEALEWKREEAEAKQAAERERQRIEEQNKRKEEAERSRIRAGEERRRKEKEEREARERAARENAAREKAAREKQQRERREREARERAAREKAAREKAQRERLEREATATLQLLVGGSNLVTFGAGFETRSLIPGFDLCTVTVRNLAPGTVRDQVARIFVEELQLEATKFHVVDLKFENDGQKAVVLTRVEEAGAIETLALEGIEHRGRHLEFEFGANALWGRMNSTGRTEDPNTLTIFWNIPATAMVVNYPSMDEAREKARELDRITIRGRRIKAAMNVMPNNAAAARHFIASSVKLTGLDPATKVIELYQRAGTTTIREIKSAVYDLPDFIRRTGVLLSRYGAVPESFQTTTEGIRVQAKVQFTSHEAAKRANTAIETGVFGKTPFLRPVLPKGHEYTISIVGQQYDAQKPLWDEIAEGATRRDDAFVRIETKNGRTYIKVVGSNQKEVGALKVRVESLVVGERLKGELWHSSFFTVAGGKFLNDIKSRTGVFVSIDRKIHALRLFGTNDAKAEAREMIEEEVKRLDFLEWSIPLKNQLIGFFLRGGGLKTLQDALGEDNVSLDLASTPVTIKIKGGDDARHHLRKLMDEALANGGVGFSTTVRDGDGGEDICPICYDQVSSPDVLSCGHTYCEGCLRHYLMSAADSKKFPLVCMGDEATCGKPIAVPIIQRYLTPQRFNRLVDVAFLTYLEQNPRTYKYCTTPDCSQIYQCDNRRTEHQCPSCFSKICGSCNEEAHGGMDCEEARLHRNPEEQERLNNQWAAQNNVKKCPQCSRMIMKGEGCNHVTCPCGAHICWRCLGLFTAGTIYEHMHSAHGGIHEPDPPPAPPVAARQLQYRIGLGRAPINTANADERRRQEEADRRFAERLVANEQAVLRETWMERYQRDQRAQELLEAQRNIRRRREEEARAEEIRRRDQANIEFVRAQEQARQQRTRTQDSEGGWCTIM